MPKDDNISIKLEISKDKDTNKLVITTRFDSSAPNFLKDEYGYIWIPTPDEIKFLNDAFELMPTGKSRASPPEKKFTKTVEKVQTYKPQAKSEEKIGESSPFERKPVSHAAKKEEDAVFEVTAEETSEEHTSKTAKELDDGIIVKADDKAIERALKKEEDEDNSIKEVDEQTIIDKVLSQKKKGKWNRPSH